MASGVSAVVDLVAFATADASDGFLIGRPLYTGFHADLDARSKVRLLPVSCGVEGAVDPMSQEMVECFEKEFRKQGEERGQSTRFDLLQVSFAASNERSLYRCFSIGLIGVFS